MKNSYSGTMNTVNVFCSTKVSCMIVTKLSTVGVTDGIVNL